MAEVMKFDEFKEHGCEAAVKVKCCALHSRHLSFSLMIVSGFGCSKSGACCALGKSLSSVCVQLKAIEFSTSLSFVQWMQPSTPYPSEESG